MPNPLIHRQNLFDLVHLATARNPSKLAIVSSDTRWTYREWEQQIRYMAQYLNQQGFQPGDKIAVYARNSAQYATLIFAAAFLAAVVVPVNFMLSPQEVAFILQHSEAQGVLADPPLCSPIDEAVNLLDPENTVLTHKIVLGPEPGKILPSGWTSIPSFSTQTSDSDLDLMGPQGSDLAQILYTSGTESRPKGVMLTHDNLIHEYVSVIAGGGFSSEDVVLHALPFYHSAQQHVFLGPYTYLGATHVIIPAPDPQSVLSMIHQEHVSEFFAPPTVWISLLRFPNFDEYDLSTLVKGHYGAAIMPREILQELKRRLPHTDFWNFYGQTEMAPLATVLGPEDQLTKLGSCGKAALNVETVLLDEENRPVSVGQIGEICHRSSHIMQGYYRDEEKTQQAFQGGWFHSGDLGVMDEEGYLTVVDRKKDMIKTGGENVASREVEEIIYQIPEVSEVAVIGMQDPYWMEKVVAVVVLKNPETLTSADVIAFCRKHLASYKIPKEVRFASSLPKNPTGKILKRDLRISLIDPAQPT